MYHVLFKINKFYRQKYFCSNFFPNFAVYTPKLHLVMTISKMWKNFGVAPLFTLLFTLLVSCASHRGAVPETFPFKFSDPNPHQLAGTKKYGIEPLEDRSELDRVKHRLKHVEECEYYAVDPLTHSVPYLTPEAAKLLKDIGKRFQKKLKQHKMGKHKIIVTSVLRTKDDVRKLMKVNSNAVSNSAHCRATTFDLSYRRFKHVEGAQANAAQMKYLLGEVLSELREKGRCSVIYETKQTCLHVTVRQ